MAVGTQFLSLIQDLRAETRRSTDVSVNSGDADTIKRVLNGVYRTLYLEHDWPHLRKVFPKIACVAGQQFYDYPAGFNPDRVIEAGVWIGSELQPINRGIREASYSFLDPAANQRLDPVLAWDVQITSGAVSQIEFWPVPASASYSVQFVGIQEITRLVNDTDLCLLDDELVLLFAAARLLKSQKAEDADLKLQEAQSYLMKLKQRPKGNAVPVQMGLGLRDNDWLSHPTIVITPK